MDVSADEFRQIFGDSDEEDVGEEGFQVGDESDLEIDGYSSEEESESEDGDSDVEEESEWSEVLEDFDVEAFDTALSGIKVEIPDRPEALFFFTLLFGEDTIDLVIAETNRVAREKLAENKSRLQQWRDITKPKFKAYLGICIMMGVAVLPRVADYWSTDPFLENRGIKAVMTKNRFEEISQYLHFNDSTREPAKGTPGYDRLYKCRPILSNILQNVQRAYYPGKDISIDEGMIAFKGRLKFRQYMPAKPTKYGIKVWMAADAANGYVLNFEVYEGSQEGNLLIHGLGYNVVMKMARPFLNRKHHLFFDNFFSTPRLFEHLLDQGTYACTTIRSNRKELPRCAKKKLKQPGELIREQKGNLLFTKWHDKRDINFLSSNVSPEQPSRTVERKVKKQTVEIEKPYVADLYTAHMGGVDQADQLRSYYYTGRTTRKWYRYVFWFLLNICVCNAHILECVHRGNNKRKQLQFHLALAKQLIGNFCLRKRPAPGAANRSPLQHISAKFEGRKKQCVQCKIAGRKTEKGYPVETKTKCTVWHCTLSSAMLQGVPRHK